MLKIQSNEGYKVVHFPFSAFNNLFCVKVLFESKNIQMQVPSQKTEFEKELQKRSKVINTFCRCGPFCFTGRGNLKPVNSSIFLC